MRPAQYKKVIVLEKIFDTIIIGAGPAGLAAGLYAGRSRLDTLIIEKQKDGGQIVITAEIENYPGGTEGVSEEKIKSMIGDAMKKFAMSLLGEQEEENG